MNHWSLQLIPVKHGGGGGLKCHTGMCFGSVATTRHPPCCSLCRPSIHSAVPISASCVPFLSSHMTIHSSTPKPFSLLHASIFHLFFSQPASHQHLPSFPPLSWLHSFMSSCLFYPSSHPTPPFLCQSAVTGLVGVTLAASMSNHSQQ